MDILFLMIIGVYLMEVNNTDKILNKHWQSGFVAFVVLCLGTALGSDLFLIL